VKHRKIMRSFVIIKLIIISDAGLSRASARMLIWQRKTLEIAETDPIADSLSQLSIVCLKFLRTANRHPDSYQDLADFVKWSFSMIKAVVL
jgi:hypothetical protein